MLKKALIGLALLSVLLALWFFQPRSPLPLAKIPVTPFTHSGKESIPEPLFVPERATNQVLRDNSAAWTATLSAEKTWTLLATGDVLTARTVNKRTLDSGSFDWPYKFVGDKLRAADITLINLETPLVEGCPIRQGTTDFCGDPRHAQALADVGIDVVNLANNHANDEEFVGLTETIEHLRAAQLHPVGLPSDPYIQFVKGTSVAFLGFNEVNRLQGINAATLNDVQKRVRAATEQADVVVVQFHWGEEYTHEPTAHQRLLAQGAAEAGADLIIGNHPHWWQPLERIGQTAVMYSHGNFVFDQMWSEETREGVVGEYIFYGDTLIDIVMTPMKIEEYGQPHWQSGDYGILTTLPETSPNPKEF